MDPTQPLDVSEQTALIRSVIASLEQVLERHGLPVPQDPPIQVGYWKRNDLYRRSGGSVGTGPMSGIRDRIILLRGLIGNGYITSSPTNDANGQREWSMFIWVSSEGTVLNEAQVLWTTMDYLSRLLCSVHEEDRFAEIFVLTFSEVECDFQVARELLPSLLLSQNRKAIELAAQKLRDREPLMEEVALADARIRQLAIDEHAAPLEYLTGVEFEELLNRHFIAYGFVVEHIGGSGDFGADLLLSAADGTVIAVQSKRWRARANLKAVQEVHGAVSYHRADLGIVVCTGGFYPSAEQLASRSGVELWGKEHITRFLNGDLAFSVLAPLACP